MILALGYSPGTGLGPSTIAANGLNCCVRDGNRCTSVAASTKIMKSFLVSGEWKVVSGPLPTYHELLTTYQRISP